MYKTILENNWRRPFRKWLENKNDDIKKYLPNLTFYVFGRECLLEAEVDEHLFKVYFQIIDKNIHTKRELIYEYAKEDVDTDDMAKLRLLIEDDKKFIPMKVIEFMYMGYPEEIGNCLSHFYSYLRCNKNVNLLVPFFTDIYDKLERD